MREAVFVAADIGATGSKLAAASFDGTKLTLKDICAKKNDPILVNGCEHADIGTMLAVVQKGISRLQETYECISLGIDTYGNGYGLLDRDGKLISRPYYYRDRRIEGVMSHVHEHFTDWQLYEEMGNYPIKTRGLFHLFEDVLEGTENISRGRVFLPLPNLLEYLLTGEAGAERTICSVLYMLDKEGNQWNFDVLKKLGIPETIFGEIWEPGIRKGIISDTFIQGNAQKGIPVVTVAGHDTESALLSIPDLDETHAFVSMGTSFIFGARVKKPIINKASYKERFKNMRGAFGSYSFCKDVPGFWLLERCMDQWRRKVPDLDYDQVSEAVRSADENHTYLNISDERFRVSEENILKVIYEYCIETGQEPVEGMKATAKCLYESYALYLRWSLNRLSEQTGIKYRKLTALNGGVRNSLLLQMMADALEIPVAAGSPWASACGNLLLQLYASGEIRSKEELAQAAFYSSRPQIYESRPSSLWRERLDEIEQKGIFMEENKNGQ